MRALKGNLYPRREDFDTEEDYEQAVQDYEDAESDYIDEAQERYYEERFNK